MELNTYIVRIKYDIKDVLTKIFNRMISKITNNLNEL